jgi:hypothetical protein
MKQTVLLLLGLTMLSLPSTAQSVGIGTNTPDPRAILELKTDSKGFLPPRLTWAQVQSITTPAEGLLVFDVTLHRFRVYTNGRWEVLGLEQKDIHDPPGHATHLIATGVASILALDAEYLPDGGLLVAGYYTGQPSFGVFQLPFAAVARTFITRYDNNGTVTWAKATGGSTIQDLAYDICLDNAGNIYVVGIFSGTVDLDPGAGTDNHISNGNSDVYFLKLDGSGNFTFGRHFGGTGSDRGLCVAFNGSSGIIIGGMFSNTVDFDPSASTTNLGSNGLTDAFFAQYDENGNFVYAKKMGGLSNEEVGNIKVSGGTIIAAGIFDNTTDFDPGAGILNLTSAGNNDIFFGSYDMSGNLQFVKRVGGAGVEHLQELFIDGSGTIYICGFFEQTCDFDPNAGTVNTTSLGSSDGFISKYTSAGAYTNHYTITSTGFESVSSVFIDNSGNMTITGTLSNSTTDVDPHPGRIMNIDHIGGNDIYVAKYNGAGEPIWAKAIGSFTDNETPACTAFSPDGKQLLILGSTSATRYKNLSGELILNNTARYFLDWYREL